MKKHDEIIILLKGLFSIFEILIGILSLIIGFSKIQSFILFIVGIELQEHTQHFIAQHIFDFTSNFSIQAGVFISIYLIIEGITKLILIWGIYKEKKSILPFAFFIFGGLVIYEIHLFLHGHSVFMLCFIILDILLLHIIYKEYVQLSKKSS